MIRTRSRSRLSHPFPGPAVSVSCFKRIAIEDTGDDVILDDECELTHGLDDLGGCAVALSATAPRQAVLGMRAARPMDDDDDLGGLVIEIGENLPDLRTMRFFRRALVLGAVQTD